MLKCRSAWAQCAILAILVLLNLLFMTAGSAIPLRKGLFGCLLRGTNGCKPRTSRTFEPHPHDRVPIKNLYPGEEESRRNRAAEVLNDVMDPPLIQSHRLSFEETDETQNPSRRSLWGRTKPGRQERLLRYQKGRDMLESSSPKTSPVGETKPLYRSPPAPPGIGNSEKQEWSLDYAEPDVHPPSSN